MAGVDREWLKQINKHFLEPDVIVFIKTNVEQAISRLDTNEKYDFWDNEKNYSSA